MYANKITTKQRDYIKSLTEQRQVNPPDLDRLMKQLRISEDPEELGMTKATASQTIEWLKAQPKIERTAPTSERSEPKAGMYRDGDRILRVYLGQQSGRMLVKELVEESGEFSYEYRGAAAYKLPKTATPLPLEEAKRFGKMTGTCCVCARRLDNPESVDAGIGPVCAGKMEGGF